VCRYNVEIGEVAPVEAMLGSGWTGYCGRSLTKSSSGTDLKFRYVFDGIMVGPVTFESF